MNAVTHLEKVITGEVSAVTHLEKVIAGETSAVTYTEKVITGEAPPITHLQKVIAGVESPVTHLEYVWAGSSPEPTEHEYTGAVPVTLNADGTPLLDFLISGNMSQTGTPTPTTPIQPSETGERTGNLFDSSTLANDYTLNATTGLPYSFPKRIATLTPIDVSTLTTVTLSYQSEITNTMFIYAVLNGSTLISRVASNHSGDTIDVSGGDKLYISFYSQPDNITIDKVSNIMLNSGESSLPYEPYGYKIPISSASTTTPVYLGEVESTRRIKKLVLTGQENWTYEEAYSRFWINVADFTTLGLRLTPFISNAFGSVSDGRPIADVPDNTIYSGATSSVDVHKIFIKCTTYTTLNAWKSYLAAQYAAGTPVTVWYVLATPETAVVNEPLRKIGDYADSISMEQAGVSIPTNNGSTTVDVETTLKPSEVYIKYKGV